MVMIFIVGCFRLFFLLFSSPAETAACGAYGGGRPILTKKFRRNIWLPSRAGLGNLRGSNFFGGGKKPSRGRFKLATNAKGTVNGEIKCSNGALVQLLGFLDEQLLYAALDLEHL